jgi:hypothetical protein
MRTLRVLFALLLSASISPAQSKSADAEASGLPRAPAEARQSADPAPEEIIRRFSAKETELYAAWMQYSYHQIAQVRVLSVNGIRKKESQTTISDIVFKDDGTREVQIKRRTSDLRSIIYTPEDEEVINNLQPFALTEKELPFYNLNYQGKEKVDELTCYVFSVTPKSTKGKRMFFEGKIWVDDQDLQVVRTVGRPVPQKKNKNLFPDFETVRQLIDKEYWFPVWTHAESKLQFDQETVHIEETITYTEYKKFASRTTIQYEDGSP